MANTHHLPSTGKEKVKTKDLLEQQQEVLWNPLESPHSLLLQKKQAENRQVGYRFSVLFTEHCILQASNRPSLVLKTFIHLDKYFN